MNIYLFKRNDSHELDWDEYRGFVVAAKNKKEAFQLINDKMKDNFIFQDATWFDVEHVGYKINSVAEILLDDYNQG